MRVRRPRPTTEIIEDREYLFHLGQLIGAAEMAAHWFSMQSSEEAVKMGEKLQGVVNWFFVEGEKSDHGDSERKRSSTEA
jgi:hypothetical protein